MSVPYGTLVPPLEHMYERGRMAEKVGIASPWMTFAREVHALFRYDPEVEVDFDNDAPELTLYVANASKADALGRLVPTEKQFGNVTMRITVVPANEDESEVELFRRAFAGNDAVADIQTVQDMFGTEVSYVEFLPRVVQFPNDNVGDLNGYSHTLYETIAKELFSPSAGTRLCTALCVGDAPLGEWP